MSPPSSTEKYLDEFLRFARERNGRALPDYVVDAFRRYLDCGRLDRGFTRLKCRRCPHEFAVGFSCRDRGICPSCMQRRMLDTSMQLCDRVLPDDVPVRQFVLTVAQPFPRASFAFRPRCRLGHDAQPPFGASTKPSGQPVKASVWLRWRAHRLRREDLDGLVEEGAGACTDGDAVPSRAWDPVPVDGLDGFGAAIDDRGEWDAIDPVYDDDV